MLDNVDFAQAHLANINYRECRFALYIPPPTPEHPDMHYIKEVVHLKDGTSFPNVRFEYDRVRPFWTTKKGFRNHDQHKEWELLSHLHQNESSERLMSRKVASALQMPWLRDIRACLDIPYVFGLDITSTACVKQEYIIKNNPPTAYTVAELDIESDVIEGTEMPTMVTLFMPPAYGLPARCHTFVTKQITSKTPNFLEKFEAKTIETLGPYINNYRTSEKKYEISNYEIKYTSSEVANDMEMWIAVFKLTNEWQPDFLSIWNMEYEMKKFEESCERYGVDPKDVMCDTRIPDDYKYYKYVQGKSQKVTASGMVMPIKPAGRWHYVTVPATYYIIDQMCTYKQVRMGEQEETSYALDAIMSKEIKITKLKFEEADHIPSNTIEWHEFMQEKYPVDYAVYNRFDCIGPAFIDEKIKDLSFTLPSMAASSDFMKFPSQPKRVCDRLHWYLQDLEEPRVLGCTSKSMVDEFDEMTIARDGWI